MSRGLNELAICMTGFPRVSGDEPAVPLTAASASLFSPRERG